MSLSTHLKPMHCDPRAYEMFLRHIECLRSYRDLLSAATAVSLHANDELDPQVVHDQVDEIRDCIKARLHTPDDVRAKLSHLHEVFFHERGFRGEKSKRVYAPLFSYVPYVLQSQRGAPIVVAMLYACVAEDLGLRVQGIDSPGHFLVRVKSLRQWMIVDPFHGGKTYTKPEAARVLQPYYETNRIRQDLLLPPATYQDWLERMLRNVIRSLKVGRYETDRQAMVELYQALKANPFRNG